MLQQSTLGQVSQTQSGRWALRGDIRVMMRCQDGEKVIKQKLTLFPGHEEQHFRHRDSNPGRSGEGQVS